MTRIPAGTKLFVDTNIFLYSISSHPVHGPWCDALFLRIARGELEGYISVIVLNELLHKLLIAEIAQKYNIPPEQVAPLLKAKRNSYSGLQSFEVIDDVMLNYNLSILPVNVESFKLTCHLMQEHVILSNDAWHLSLMQQSGITNLVTNDKDFDRIRTIQVWKPQANSQV